MKERKFERKFIRSREYAAFLKFKLFAKKNVPAENISNEFRVELHVKFVWKSREIRLDLCGIRRINYD